MSASRTPVTHHEIRFMADRLLAENTGPDIRTAIRSLQQLERVYKSRGVRAPAGLTVFEEVIARGEVRS